MRDLAFLDFETTGLVPNRHEIIEAAVVRADGRTLRELGAVSVRIAPRHIETADPEALAVNGYDPKTWGGVTLEDALPALEPLLADAFVAGCSVARFDVPFLMAAYDQVLRPRPAFGKYQLNIESLCWPLMMRGQVESLSLRALCDYYGVSNVGAHGALVDCRRALEVTRRAMGMGPPCKCQLEIGDSPCPRHGDTECPACGEQFVESQGHQCTKAKPEPAKVEVVRFEKKEGGAS